jgi:hypothetical protein
VFVIAGGVGRRVEAVVVSAEALETALIVIGFS